MSTSINIFVVDKEVKTAEMLKNHLEIYGFNIFSVNDGTNAIRLFDEINPQIVLLDMMLTDMPSEIICAFIRYRSTVPIIILSSDDDEDSILNGFKIGADDYIVKPFSIPQLVARINALLRRYHEGMNQKAPA